MTWVLLFQEQNGVHRFGAIWTYKIGSHCRDPAVQSDNGPQELRQLLQLKDTALQMLQEEVLQLQELGKGHRKWMPHGKIIVQPWGNQDQA